MHLFIYLLSDIYYQIYCGYVTCGHGDLTNVNFSIFSLY